RPKPRHSGQAPSGLLKLNRPADGGRISMSQWAQCQPVEKGIAESGDRIADGFCSCDTSAFSVFQDPLPGIGMMFTLPLPKRSAVSIASTRRARFSDVIVTRS